MNKKANLSLVILSVVALFSIGSIAIMYGNGATGAVTVDKSSRLCVDPEVIILPEGPLVKCRQITPVPETGPPQGWTILPYPGTATLDDGFSEPTLCVGEAFMSPTIKVGVWNRCFP